MNRKKKFHHAKKVLRQDSEPSISDLQQYIGTIFFALRSSPTHIATDYLHVQVFLQIFKIHFTWTLFLQVLPVFGPNHLHSRNASLPRFLPGPLALASFPRFREKSIYMDPFFRPSKFFFSKVSLHGPNFCKFTPFLPQITCRNLVHVNLPPKNGCKFTLFLPQITCTG